VTRITTWQRKSEMLSHAYLFGRCDQKTPTRVHTTGSSTMQAGILMGVYILTLVSVQFIGFVVSRLVEFQWPTVGLMTFLLLFMAAFGAAWPIAVLIAEWAIRSMGYVVEVAQSGVHGRRDIAPSRAAN
jgi:hypothetical protein